MKLGTDGFWALPLALLVCLLVLAALEAISLSGFEIPSNLAWVNCACWTFCAKMPQVQISTSEKEKVSVFFIIVLLQENKVLVKPSTIVPIAEVRILAVAIRHKLRTCTCCQSNKPKFVSEMSNFENALYQPIQQPTSANRKIWHRGSTRLTQLN